MNYQLEDSDGLELLIGIFLNHHFYVEMVEDVSEIIYELINKHQDSLMIKRDDKISFNVPYHKIADAIFNHKEFISFDSLENFVSAVYSALSRKKSEHITICYNKLTRHILLSVKQKIFITETTQEANRVAKQASETARDTEKLAKETAGEIKNSVVNYITILGIFATIIFALFGGVNLISAINSLLASQHRPRLATIILLMSLLTLVISTLLVMLMSWLIEVRGLGEKSWKNKVYLKIYLGILVFTIFTMFVSGLVIFNFL